MFWDVFTDLCVKKNSTPTAVCLEIGLSNATATKWKSGAIPRETTLIKIAEYFGVTVDYLLGNTEKAVQVGEPPDGMTRVTIHGRDGKTEYADFTPEQVELIRAMIEKKKKKD